MEFNIDKDNKQSTSSQQKITQVLEQTKNCKKKYKSSPPESDTKTDNKENDLNSIFQLKEETILQDIQILAHSSVCTDENCGDTYCQKMKLLINHPRNCRNPKTCLICKKLFEIVFHHANRCVEAESKCSVIYCSQIKNRYKQIQQKALESTKDEAIPREFNLVHACKCTTAKCNEPNCQSTKWLMNHPKNCKVLKGCTTCKKLFLQCTNHAKCCSNINCTVLYCKHIKDKFRQYQMRKEKKEEKQPDIKIFVNCDTNTDNKNIILNTKNCKQTGRRCPICLQVLAICCFHAKNCQKTNCKVAFCSPIKHKLKNQSQTL